MICSFFRGRLSIPDAYNLPLGTLNTLHFLAIKNSESDAGKNKMQGEILEDALGG